MASNSLTVRILGGEDIGPVDGFDYYSGEERELTFQIMNEQTDEKYALPAGVEDLKLTFPSSPDDLEIEVDEDEINADDRSIITVTLDEETTEEMISGWMKFEWDDDGAHRIAYAEFIQTKLTTGAE